MGKSGAITESAQLGFDGVYLDWVEAYDDRRVRAAAKEAKLDPKIEMIRFVEEILAAGLAVTPEFLAVPQNALGLLSHAPERYAAVIDGIGVEDTWFHGTAGAKWDSGKRRRPAEQG